MVTYMDFRGRDVRLYIWVAVRRWTGETLCDRCP